MRHRSGRIGADNAMKCIFNLLIELVLYGRKHMFLIS